MSLFSHFFLSNHEEILPLYGETDTLSVPRTTVLGKRKPSPLFPDGQIGSVQAPPPFSLAWHRATFLLSSDPDPIGSSLDSSLQSLQPQPRLYRYPLKERFLTVKGNMLSGSFGSPGSLQPPGAPSRFPAAGTPVPSTNNAAFRPRQSSFTI